MGKKERRSFSKEFNLDAVRRAEAGGHSFTQIARELGIQASLLKVWRLKHGSVGAADLSAEKPISLEEENRRLRRENAALREDREIKKSILGNGTRDLNPRRHLRIEPLST